MGTGLRHKRDVGWQIVLDAGDKETTRGMPLFLGRSHRDSIRDASNGSVRLALSHDRIKTISTARLQVRGK